MINHSGTFRYVRILLAMTSLKNQDIGHMDYHKLQGFIYGRLIAATSFGDIHNTTSYKHFSFSNIFPPTPPKSGETRHLIFASPNAELVHQIFKVISFIVQEQKAVNIGDQSYNVSSARLLTVGLKNNCTLRTATPATMRLSEKSYERLGVPENIRKDKFIYWRSNIPVDIFIKLVDENIRKKFESFYGTRLELQDPVIDTVSFLRQVVISLPIEERTFKIPAGFWEFHFDNLRGVRKQVVEFALDDGVGERTSFGLGFLNASHGSETTEISAISAQGKN